jgi:hypothetical protein
LEPPQTDAKPCHPVQNGTGWPTVQIASKYAGILIFLLSGNTSPKTNLPTICQL